MQTNLFENLTLFQIIWDPDKKEWINTEATEEEKTKSAPPPRDMDLMKGETQKNRALYLVAPGRVKWNLE